jgi:SecD/SecF fusion protein
VFGIKLVPEGTKYKFMDARFFGIAFSAFLSVSSIALFIYPGLNYGVDFRGGIQMEVVTSGPADLAQMRARLDGLNLGEIALQEYGDVSRVLVRAERQPGGEEAQSAAVESIRQAVTALDSGASIERTEVVGPKVSGELAYAGVLSVVLASFAMLLYIWFRFEWPFAVGAIATLISTSRNALGSSR